MYTFSKTAPTDALWDIIEASPDSTVFVSRQWQLFLNKQRQRTLIVQVKGNEEDLIGYFVGSRKWYGIHIAGAPLGGTATYLGGLCATHSMTPEERVAVYKQLAEWCFKRHLASYLQITDWQLRDEYQQYIPIETWRNPLLDNEEIHHTLRATYLLDTSVTEEEMWRRSSYSSFRYCVNKARKEELKIHLITRREEIPAFIETLHRQITNVSQRKGVAPHLHQKPERLKALCECLFPDRVLMIQVLGNDKNGQQQIMSSAIFCVDKEVSTYLSGASFQQYMKYCPNEIMVWEGLRELHRRGSHYLILGDTATYKAKFGPTYAYLPMMIFSRTKLLLNARKEIKLLYWRLRNLKTKR